MTHSECSKQLTEIMAGFLFLFISIHFSSFRFEPKIPMTKNDNDNTIPTSKSKFRFSIDRGGTFTDVYAEVPSDNLESSHEFRVLKLLSVDPQNYKDAPTEGIRRILEDVLIYSKKLTSPPPFFPLVALDISNIFIFIYLFFF